jgi:hypothetical protein
MAKASQKEPNARNWTKRAELDGTSPPHGTPCEAHQRMRMHDELPKLDSISRAPG